MPSAPWTAPAASRSGSARRMAIPCWSFPMTGRACPSISGAGPASPSSPDGPKARAWAWPWWPISCAAGGEKCTSAPPPEPARQSKSASRRRKTMMSKHILVADDSAANRLALRLELLDQGFSVDEAEDGKAAIAMLGHTRYDAVITDVWMPGADGIAVVQAIRKQAPGVPVFVITGGGPGLSIASAAALAEGWGAQKGYVKPFDVRILVAELEAALAS